MSTAVSETSTEVEIAGAAAHPAGWVAAPVQPVRQSLFARPDQDFAGIRRLELPIPFAPGSVNVYLVPLADGGWILLDCGINLPDVLSAYEAAGFQWSGIRRIILTHSHPDHSGLSPRIRELTGAPISMHRNEQEVLSGLGDPESWIDSQERTLRAAGVPQNSRFHIHGVSRKLRDLCPAITADSYIEDGDVIQTALGPMQALLTPGHSPGHLCFYFPEKRILLAGDQLLRPGSPHIAWYREGCALEEYRASLRAMARLDVEWVLPSHGRAFRGHKDRIESLLEHSLEMEEKIHSLLSGGVNTPHELARAAWRISLPPFEHRNAVFEVLAYLQRPLSSRVQ